MNADICLADSICVVLEFCRDTKAKVRLYFKMYSKPKSQAHSPLHFIASCGLQLRLKKKLVKMNHMRSMMTLVQHCQMTGEQNIFMGKGGCSLHVNTFCLIYETLLAQCLSESINLCNCTITKRKPLCVEKISVFKNTFDRFQNKLRSFRLKA